MPDRGDKRALRILMAGSGTAGPVVPLVAIVDELRRRNIAHDALFLGTDAGPERAIVEAADIPFKAFPAGKFRRYFSLKNFIDLFKIAWAFVRALGLVLRRDPDAFVSAGGFIAPPIAWACWLLGVPVVLHQQDVKPILSDKLMVRFARRITVTFEASLQSFPADKAVWTGNPVRSGLADGTAVEGRKRFSLGLSKPTILATGGGTGAESLNRALIRALPKLLPVCNVVHLTGKGKELTSELEAVAQGGTSLKNYRPIPFLHEMEDAYAVADVVVCRAGFSTLSELAFLGKAAIAVPLPDSPQVANAETFAKRGALQTLSAAQIEEGALGDAVLALLGDDARRREMAKKMSESMKQDAAAALVEEIRSVVSS